jgi:hypothetical protein
MDRRIVIPALIGLVVAVLVASTGCVRQVGPPVTPKPSEAPAEFWTQPESFVPDSDTVVIGWVVKGLLPPIEMEGSIYRDWVVNVEEYIVKPLPYSSIKVRIQEQSGGIPVKGPHLKEGEHLLLFLKKENEHFTLVGGLMGAKFVIDNGRVRYDLYAYSPWEALDEVIARVKAVAETWAAEKLTDERRAEITKIALDDPGIKEYLTGKDHEVGSVAPYTAGVVPDEIRYLVSIDIPKRSRLELQLAVVVNVTDKKVDKISVNLYYAELTEKERNEASQIALADSTVQKLIGDRGYEVADISKDSFQEKHDGKTSFYIFPKVVTLLEPAISEILEIYVDPNQKKVVKIFTESYLSSKLLESTASDRDFTLTVRIPKTEYRVGEVAKAILTLSYTGDQPVELTSSDRQYFDLLVRDGNGNIIYHWEQERYGSPPLSLPTAKETLMPGQSITGRIEFSVPQAGTFYLRGRNFGGWDFGQVLATYLDGGGHGLYIEAPFLVVTAR